MVNKIEYSFPYGESDIKFKISEVIHVDIIRAPLEEPLKDPKMEIIKKLKEPLLSKPLEDLLKSRKEGKVCIVISDSTRPVPSKIIIEPILELCETLNIQDDDIQILIATGLHRKTSPDELMKMLGKDIVFRYDIINHVAEDYDSLKDMGKNSFGSPIYINKNYIEASIKIITGYVEPHFFAGFSGGRKSIVPGIAGAETILANHSAKNIANDQTRFGILDGNPVYDDAINTVKMKEITPDFIVNVCINPQHKITKVIAGGLQAYKELVDYQKQIVFENIDEKYDVVITTNGGAPLDMNLYQAVKSMAIGELAVKEGGTIITINECKDKVGQPRFEELINLDLSPEQIFAQVTSGEICCKDGWEIQVCTRVLSLADIYVISEMSEKELGTIGLKYAETVEEALKNCLERYGKDLRILLLPYGPMRLPLIR